MSFISILFQYQQEEFCFRMAWQPPWDLSVPHPGGSLLACVSCSVLSVSVGVFQHPGATCPSLSSHSIADHVFPSPGTGRHGCHMRTLFLVRVAVFASRSRRTWMLQDIADGKQQLSKAVWASDFSSFLRYRQVQSNRQKVKILQKPWARGLKGKGITKNEEGAEHTAS